jgi:hypothetical protein
VKLSSFFLSLSAQSSAAGVMSRIEFLATTGPNPLPKESALRIKKAARACEDFSEKRKTGQKALE